MDISAFRDVSTVVDYSDKHLPIEYQIPHHNPLCIPGSLSYAKPVEHSYKEIKLFKQFLDILKAPLVSGAQIDAALCGMSQFCKRLRNGLQTGIYIGDQTGCGKSRIAALIIAELLYTMMIRKVLWISSNIHLQSGAYEELAAMKCFNLKRKTNFVVYDGRKTEEQMLHTLENPEEDENTIVFTAYSALVAGGKDKPHLFKIAKWMGSDFNGVIILDECHKARNEKTSTSLIVKWLHFKFPLAKIVYMTATVGSEPCHISYMSRLELWGEGCPFFDKNDFVDQMSVRGLSAMEFVAIHLHWRGCYVARQLNIKDVQVINDEMKLSVAQEAVYDVCCLLWQALLMHIESMDPSELEDREMSPSAYWSRHQRFFDALLLTFKAEYISTLAEKYPPNEYSLVVALQFTGNEAWCRLHQKEQQTSPFSLCGTMIKELYRKLKIPVPEFGETLDAATLENVTVVEKELVQMYQTLIPGLGRNPIDQIIEDLGGFEECGEISGRISRQAPAKDSEEGFICQSMSSHSVDDERDQFMNGEVMKSIVITQKGATGISLHSDRNVKNQNRRVQVLLQTPWSPEHAVQQLGRTNRSGQVNAPILYLLRTNVPGEQRFSTVLVSRLSKMGAMGQGERRATFNLADSSKYPFGSHPEIASKAAKSVVLKIKEGGDSYLYTEAGKVNLLPKGNTTNYTVPITRFLNRVLGMQLKAQREIFDLLSMEYNHLLREMTQSGEIDGDMLGSFPGLALEWASELVYGKGDQACKIFKILADRGLSWAGIEQHVETQRRKDKDRALLYYVKGKEVIFALEGLVYENKVRSYTVWTPWSCNSQVWLDHVIQDGWKLESNMAIVQSRWKAMYEAGRVKEMCIHRFSNENCDTANCTERTRRFYIYVLGGNVLKVWERLSKVFKPHDSKPPIAPMDSIRISMSQKTKSGVSKVRFVGINIPQDLLDDVKAALSTVYATVQNPHELAAARKIAENDVIEEVEAIESEWLEFVAGQKENNVEMDEESKEEESMEEQSMEEESVEDNDDQQSLPEEPEEDSNESSESENENEQIKENTCAVVDSCDEASDEMDTTSSDGSYQVMETEGDSSESDSSNQLFESDYEDE